MKSKISFICTAAILLTVTSCSGRQGADTGLISINYKELTDKGTVNLSDLFEEPEFIALDSRRPQSRSIRHGGNKYLRTAYRHLQRILPGQSIQTL